MPYHGKYRSPTELLLDESLSRDEKIKMLEQWRDDKKAIIRASEEGMHGDNKSEILRKIKNALISLKEGSSNQ